MSPGLLLSFKTLSPNGRMLGATDSTRHIRVQLIWGLFEQKHLVALEAKKQSCKERQTLGAAGTTQKHKDRSSAWVQPTGGSGGHTLVFRAIWLPATARSSSAPEGQHWTLHHANAHPRLPGSQKLLRTHGAFHPHRRHEIWR